MADITLNIPGGTLGTKQQSDGVQALRVFSVGADGAGASGGVASAGENHIGEVGGNSALIDFTLSLDTSAYASGDLLADSQSIASAMRATDKTAVLQSLTLNDKDDQGVAMTLYFLSANVSMGTENAAPSISDANADNILGYVDIAASDWKDIGGTRIASVRSIGLLLKPVSGGTNIYIAAVNGTGTPTFTAAGITGKLGLLRD